ncbi:MAG: class I SAM-dependent methyltransferase [Planctomycetota bacterium]
MWLCTACGFISNRAFDPTLGEYSASYEETQHYSREFTAFAHDLAKSWIERYNLHGKNILEIGCGKGEFLDLICRLGNNQGIGLDPACIPDRLPASAASRVTLIRDVYGAKYGYLAPDVILCRHTLEHIPDASEFVADLRSVIGRGRDVLLLFELPDVTRVLRECAFWDVYYEHCSYFTAGSLARLFRRNRFELVDVKRVYGNQYLVLECRAADAPTASRFAVEDDLAQTVADTQSFSDSTSSEIKQWNDRLAHFAMQKQRTIAWGAGSKCVAFCTTLGVTDEIDYVVDINPHKQGMYLPGTGHRVVGIQHLREHPPNKIVVMNPIYRGEIQRELDRIGVQAELLPV